MDITKNIFFTDGRKEKTVYMPVDDIMTAYARCINMAREDYKQINEEFRSYYTVSENVADSNISIGKDIVECNNEDGVIVIIDGRKFCNMSKPIK